MRQRLSQVHAIEPTERAAIVGKTGTGKTTLARCLLKLYPYVVVIDTKGTFEFNDNRAEYIYNLRELSRVDPDDTRPIIVRFRAPGDDSEHADAVCRWCYERQNCTVYIDEAYDLCRDQYRPEWLRRLLKQGRELRIRTIVSTQRPAWVPLDILSEAEHYMCFRLHLSDDRRRMAELMGEESFRELSDEHSYHYYNAKNDEHRICRLDLGE